MEYLQVAGDAWRVTRILQNSNRIFTVQKNFISEHYELSQFYETDEATLFDEEDADEDDNNEKEAEEFAFSREELEFLQNHQPKKKELSIRDKTKQETSYLLACPHVLEGCSHIQLFKSPVTLSNHLQTKHSDDKKTADACVQKMAKQACENSKYFRDHNIASLTVLQLKSHLQMLKPETANTSEVATPLRDSFSLFQRVSIPIV